MRPGALAAAPFRSPASNDFATAPMLLGTPSTAGPGLRAKRGGAASGFAPYALDSRHKSMYVVTHILSVCMYIYIYTHIHTHVISRPRESHWLIEIRLECHLPGGTCAPQLSRHIV